MKVSYRGSGKVFYKDQEFECELYWNEEEGGILLKVIVRESMASYLALPLDIEEIAGELSNGYKFTLVSAIRTGMNNNISQHRSTYSYEAKFLLQGIGKENANLQFHRMYFSMPEIIEWGEVSGYKVNKADYSLKNNEDTDKELYSDTHVKISYIVRSSFLPCTNFELYRNKIVLEQQGIISIEISEGASIEAFLEWFYKINKLIELCTVKKHAPNKITGISKSIVDKYGTDEVPREINIVSGVCCNTQKGNDDGIGRARLNWLVLTELLENNSIYEYLNKQDKLEPVIELYTELLHMTGISRRRVFLNIVQAMETFHSRMITNDKNVYKERVKTIISKRPERDQDDFRKFLYGGHDNLNKLPLSSRIADLLYADGEFYFDTGDIKHIDFPTIVANTRNYYIHYDERIKEIGTVWSEEDLEIYNRCLFYILEYHILRELGFEDGEKLRNKLNMRWGNISQDLAIQKESDKMKS